MKDDFDVFADKVSALGRAMNLKGGRAAVQFLLANKGVATRTDIGKSAGLTPKEVFPIVNTLKDGGLIEVPSRSSFIYLNPGVKDAMKAMSKAAKPEGVLMLKHGQKVAQFTRYDGVDPIVEGTCGPYSFTATMSDDAKKGLWDCGVDHFVMRDMENGVACATYSIETDWTSRPKNGKQMAHIILIERLFRAAPKIY